MNDDSGWIWDLLRQLRSDEAMPLAPSDANALFQAIGAGFGTTSKEALCELCCTLWAKSPRNREAIINHFERNFVADTPNDNPGVSLAPDTHVSELNRHETELGSQQVARELSTVSPSAEDLSLRQRRPDRPTALPPPLNIPQQILNAHPTRLTLNYGLDARAITQAGRRLRLPVRQGFFAEPDVEATIRERCQNGGLPTPVVFRERLRNAARITLFIDRKLAMTPFHGLCDFVRDALIAAGPADWLHCWYFSELPQLDCEGTITRSTNEHAFQAALRLIPAARAGFVYSSPALIGTIPLRSVLNTLHSAAVIIISDGGALKRDSSERRLIDTFAFLNALERHTARIIWLNPLPTERWGDGVNLMVCHRLRMFAMTNEQIDRALNSLSVRK